MPNINVNGTLFPTVSGVPTHNDQYGKGGYRSVADSTALAAIPLAYKTTGMMVHQWNTHQTFLWNGSTWVENLFIDDGSISTAKLADLSVTEEKIAVGGVTETRLASDSVTHDKIAAGAVEHDSLSNGASIKFDSIEIFNGTSPIVSTTIALSGHIGTVTSAMTFISVANTSGTPSTYKFGGDTIYDAGASVVTLSGGQKGMIVVHTNASAQIKWTSTAGVATTITLLAFGR